MKIQVTVNNVIIQEKNILNENEYNVHECEFEFVEEYDGLTKKAVFTGIDGKTYVQTIIDDKCYIPSEILAKRQNVKIGVYGYDVENEELILRYSPRPTEFTIHEGSYKEGENTTPPTPSEIEQLQAQITENANDIDGIIGDIVDINGDITDIKAEQTTQNENIQTNANNIGTINGQIVTINQDIDNLGRTKADKSEIPTKTSDLINDSDFVSDENYVHTDNNFTNEKDAQITTNASNITTLQSTKADKSEIPTKTSQLTNDSGFITKNVDDLANYYKKSETYNKTEIDGKVSSVYKYKGTVATYQDLPSTDLTIGDVYNVEEDGSNYAWTGNAWDKLGGDIDLSEYYTKTQTDSLLSAKANASEVYTKNETYNKIEVNTLLNDKVDKVDGKGLSTEDFTTSEKTKLAGIEAEANKTVVDSEMNSTSTNPVENQVIYASQEVQNVRISELEQDVEDLRGACYKVSGTGTDITLNNTASARLLDIELKGNTEQDTLTGKNLLKTSLDDMKTRNTSGTWNNNVYTLNGLNFTVNADLSITITGTFSTNTTFFITKAYFTITPDTYRLSGGLNSNGRIICDLTNNGTYVASYEDTGSGRTINLSNYANPSVNFYLSIRGSENINKTVYPMLEQGSTTTDFEPYCGGIPAPNPTYEMPIKNVTGSANVLVQNKNLFDKNITPNSRWQLTSEVYQNGIKLISTANSGVCYVSYKFSILALSSMYFNFTLNGNGKVNVYFRDENNNNIKSFVNKTEPFSMTDIPEEATQIFILFYGSTTNIGNITIFDNIQLEQGSTATSYVPHQEQNLPLTLGNIELNKIDTAQDYFYKKNNKWYLHKEIMKRTITNVSSVGTASSGIQYASMGSISNVKSNSFVYCPNYINSTDATKNNSIRMAVATLLVYDNRFSDTETALSLLNGLEYYHIMATPTETEMTDTTLINQLEATLQARSYDDITYITSTSEELGFNMDVESLGNINKVINNLLNN